MQLSFYKYQGNGNDFIILDAIIEGLPDLDNSQVQKLCDRRFGIGADGLMVIKKNPDCDFEMQYFNADGKEGSLCGNGSRCIVSYAFSKKYIKDHTRFLASDGIHSAEILPDGMISLQMNDVQDIEYLNPDLELNTGSPHYIRIVSDVNGIDVVNEGRNIRNSGKYKTDGINVNFLEQENDLLKIRTYERGVEDETLSCGTGAVASALVHAFLVKDETGEYIVSTKGGLLKVKFKRNGKAFTDILLTGPAEFVFKGQIEIL